MILIAVAAQGVANPLGFDLIDGARAAEIAFALGAHARGQVAGAGVSVLDLARGG